MDKMHLKNLVGGGEIGLGKEFEVKSEFYNDYVTSVTDSNMFDIKMAISKVKAAEAECNRLSFEERKKILKKAANKLKFNWEDYEYIVKYTGMPIRSVRKHLGDIIKILEIVPELVEKRIGTKHGRIGHKPIEGHDLFKFLQPITGYAYVVTPANDPRVTAFVAAWLVTLGIPGVFKVAKTDVFSAQKTMRAIIDSGYPVGALNQLCWDTANEETKKLNFSLADASTAIWAFGTDETVDNLLRFERSGNGGINHFSGKVVLRHATGRAAGIYDGTYNIKETAKIIAESALDWPIACNSIKSVFDASPKHELLEQLREQFDDYAAFTGDPLEEGTKVGYISSKLNNHIYSRIASLERLGVIKRTTGEKLNEFQTTPIILNIQDEHSEFLSSEYSTYITAVKECASFEDAVECSNYAAGKQHRLVVSVFSEERDKILKTILKAHHVKRARHTTELDVLFHEGNDYLHRLTTPQIHRVDI